MMAQLKRQVFMLTVSITITAGFQEAATASAVSLGGASTYSQNFNSLPATGSVAWADDSTIRGWFAPRTGSGTYIAASNGNTTIGNLYSFGTDAEADRALGSIATASSTVGRFAYGAYFQNDNSTVIDSIALGFTGEQWRNSASPAQTITFSYRVGGSGFTEPTSGPPPNGWTLFPSLNFTSPKTGSPAGPLDGNSAANRVVVASTLLTGVHLEPGEQLWIRWDDPDHTGADHGLSIDDFSLTWTVVPEPASSAMLLLGGAWLFFIQPGRCRQGNF